MFDTELNSFVGKFQELRSAGRNAHLDLHSEGGQCFVSLRVQLGEAGQQPHHRHHQQVRRGLRRSPAYHRRKARRRAARQAAGNGQALQMGCIGVSGSFFRGGQQLHPAKIQSLPAEIYSCQWGHVFCQAAVPSFSAKLSCSANGQIGR